MPKHLERLITVTSIPQKPIDYGPLDEWRRYYKIYYKDMAKMVGVYPGALSRYRSAGRPFPSDWILTWMDRYRLPIDEIGRLFYTREETRYAKA